MNKGSLKELEQSYKHLKARLQALINPEAQTFNAKKDLQAAQLWVERNAADDEGADGRCPSRYVVFMCFKLTKIFITYYLYCFSHSCQLSRILRETPAFREEENVFL